jgi:AcrR family transcriptional regulator
VARRGRRPGRSQTRDDILESARRSFADLGYDRATIRGIAREADVDPALVMHFFGNKERIFAEVMSLPFDAETVSARVLAGSRREIGLRLTRFFLEVWDDPVLGAGMLALVRSAASYPEAADRLRELVSANIVPLIAGSVEGRDAELRSNMVSAQLIGTAFLRYVLRVEPVASTDREALAQTLAPTIQRYLTGR